MTQRFACPNGHHWEVPAIPDTEQPMLTCPVCAAEGAVPAGNPTLVPDELPPLPRPLTRRGPTVAGYEILEELGLQIAVADGGRRRHLEAPAQSGRPFPAPHGF